MQIFINIFMMSIYCFIIVRIVFYKKTTIQLLFDKNKVFTIHYYRDTQGLKFYCYYFVITIYNYDLMKYYRTMAKEIFKFDEEQGQAKRWLK